MKKLFARLFSFALSDLISELQRQHTFNVYSQRRILEALQNIKKHMDYRAGQSADSLARLVEIAERKHKIDVAQRGF